MYANAREKYVNMQDISEWHNIDRLKCKLSIL